MAKTNEGVILTDPETDAAFHNPILGDDQLPPEILDQLRAQAEALGLDPRLIQR